MTGIMNFRFKFLKNQKGLTLVELLAVIVILGVIAAIAVPSIGSVIQSSKTKADEQSVILIQEAAVLYAIGESIATTTTTVAIADLVAKGYLKSTPSSQATGGAYTVTLSHSPTAGWSATAVAAAATPTPTPSAT